MAYSKGRRVTKYEDINRLHKAHPTTWIIGIVIPLVFLSLWFFLLLNPYIESVRAAFVVILTAAIVGVTVYVTKPPHNPSN